MKYSSLFFIPLFLLVSHGITTSDEQTVITTSDANTPDAPAKTLSNDELEQKMYDWSRVFAETLHLATQKHFNPMHIDQAMTKALDAFCSTLDPHSSFLDPKAYKAINEATSGEFGGVGIAMDNSRKTKDKFLLIIDVIPDGPAEKAGIKALDKIIAIDDKSVEGMTTDEIAGLLRGQSGTSVQVKIIREGQQDLLNFTLTREFIKDQSSLCFFLEDRQIYYFSLSMFNDNATKQIESLLTQANKNKYKGLMLDLRYNTGGLLTAAIDIAGLFLKKGSLVVTTKDRNNKEVERYTTNNEPVSKSSVPIFILVNNYTASAAEILAGALQTYSETAGNTYPPIFVVGTPTFGKGSVQEVIPIGNNCAVKMTIRLYYLPNNISVQGNGITPDFVIERTTPPTEQMTWFTKNYGRENVLENFIKPPDFKESEKEKASAADKSGKERWQERAKHILETDNQVRQTIALIDLLSNAQTHCPKLVESRSKARAFLSSVFVGDKPLSPKEIKLCK